MRDDWLRRRRNRAILNALVHAEQETGTQARLSAIQTLDSGQTPFWKRLDVRKSLVCGLTVALTFVVWMLANWPVGTFAIFFAVLITGKNCTAPYLPPKALIPCAIVGILVGSVVHLGVLPMLDGFWQLALVLFPFCAIELDHMRCPRDARVHSASLADFGERVNQELCKVLERLVHSLEQCSPVPQLPHRKVLFEELNIAFGELYEGIRDEAARRNAARHALVMMGQYDALLDAVAKCHAQLKELDWKSLNQDYL